MATGGARRPEDRAEDDAARSDLTGAAPRIHAIAEPAHGLDVAAPSLRRSRAMNTSTVFESRSKPCA